MAFIHFIIPIRDKASVGNWRKVEEELSITLGSLVGQSDSDWECTVVHDIDSKLDIKISDSRIRYFSRKIEYIPPAPSLDGEEMNKYVRFDKGKRLYEGLTRAGQSSEFTMVVDYDDILHRDLVSTIKKKSQFDIVAISRAYAYDGGRLVQKLKMNEDGVGVGGSATAVKTSILFDESFFGSKENLINKYLGSHIFLIPDVRKFGGSIKFVEAFLLLYRVGSSHATSGSKKNIKSLKRALRRGDFLGIFKAFSNLSILSNKKLENFSIL